MDDIRKKKNVMKAKDDIVTKDGNKNQIKQKKEKEKRS